MASGTGQQGGGDLNMTLTATNVMTRNGSPFYHGETTHKFFGLDRAQASKIEEVANRGMSFINEGLVQLAQQNAGGSDQGGSQSGSQSGHVQSQSGFQQQPR